MGNKEKIIALILKSEGGLNEQEPESVGAVSYAGITQKIYDAYLPRLRETLGDNGVPNSVRNLASYDKVIPAFYDLYLGDYNVWRLPEFLQYMYADFVTNAGAAAVKIVQGFAGVSADGVFGSGTRAAVDAWTKKVSEELAVDKTVDNKLIIAFHEAKLAHYDRLVRANPAKFGKWHEGWKRRANHVLSELSEYFETDEPTPSAMDDADVPTHVESSEKLTIEQKLVKKVLELERRINEHEKTIVDYNDRLVKLETKPRLDL